MTSRIQVFSDAEALSLAAAEQVVLSARAAIARRGEFHLVLSGGSTPKRLYEQLASPQFRGRVDWSRVHIYFGDERSVPPDHPDSNFRMANTALMQPLTLDSSHVHRMQGEQQDLEQAARDYARIIQLRVPQTNALPVFDLVLLGMGDDGHTASLFPQTTALKEKDRLVAPVYVEKLHTWRLTLTYPVINNAQQVLFLIAGSSKAQRLAEVLTGQPVDYPVKAVQPRGELLWYLDESAAALLPQEIRA
ncbi:MAG: 6-phosphogluconolactonase [Pseudomonadota bacterium]